jgi:hypothetical protein
VKLSLKLCVPHVIRRGSGLGNELIPWARTLVAGAVLGARVLPPAFGINKRKYRRHFNTPHFDWITHRVIEQILPRFEFTEADFYEYGGDCLSDTIRYYAIKHKLAERAAWVWTTQGMWGGYRHVIEARELLRSTLYLSHFAASNLAKIHSRLDPKRITVGMHVRLGDFQSAIHPNEYRGRFNVTLPLQWYINIAQSLCTQLDKKVQFLVVSDGTIEQLAPLLEVCDAVTTLDISDSDVSDMLALAGADLLVCSVSTYSGWSAFLSDSPYLWFEPNLQKFDGYYSIWGHEERQLQPGSYTRKSMDEIEASRIQYPIRGLPISIDGIIPPGLVETLINKQIQKQSACDLLYYGVIPIE